MDRTTRLQTLSDFLKSKRAKLLPESLGLPAGTRRRTPGLRREEVAQLAGVSPTWYTWLEQGRDIRVSPSVLDCVATALRLTEDERKYVYALALETGSGAQLWKDNAAHSEISPSLKKIISELQNCPTIITDRHYDIVAWNEAAAHVFLDFDQIPQDERNMIRLLFARKELQRLAVNWGQFVRGFLAMFRSYYGQYFEDDWYERFVQEMQGIHPQFESLWRQSEVQSAPEVLIEFRHAQAGKMLFHLTSLLVQGNAELRCSIYTPVPDSTTENKLKKLMGRRP